MSLANGPPEKFTLRLRPDLPAFPSGAFHRLIKWENCKFNRKDAPSFNRLSAGNHTMVSDLPLESSDISFKDGLVIAMTLAEVEWLSEFYILGFSMDEGIGGRMVHNWSKAKILSLVRPMPDQMGSRIEQANRIFRKWLKHPHGLRLPLDAREYEVGPLEPKRSIDEIT